MLWRTRSLQPYHCLQLCGSRLCLPADKERGSFEEKVDAGARSQPAGLSTSPAQHQSPGPISDSAIVGARQPQTSGTGQGGQRKRTASGELCSRDGTLWLSDTCGTQGCKHLLQTSGALRARASQYDQKDCQSLRICSLPSLQWSLEAPLSSKVL